MIDLDENKTPEAIIAEAMVSAGAPLMHSRVEEAVAGALRKAGMLAEQPGQVCAWCPSPARGSAHHNDGKLHPSCGQTNHGQGWVPDYPVERIGAIEAERDAALARIAEIERGVEITRATSDGYHTFDELYEYRMLYNAHAAHGWLAAGIPVVKSWKHSDGEPCFGGGWFIVTATLPAGQVSNHYKAEHWGLFKVPEVELPPKYDGHTPHDAAMRLRIEAEHASRGRANTAEARIAEAAKLHRPDWSDWGIDHPEEGASCSCGANYSYDECPTRIALGLNEGENDE